MHDASAVLSMVSVPWLTKATAAMRDGNMVSQSVRVVASPLLAQQFRAAAQNALASATREAPVLPADPPVPPGLLPAVPLPPRPLPPVALPPVPIPPVPPPRAPPPPTLLPPSPPPPVLFPPVPLPSVLLPPVPLRPPDPLPPRLRLPPLPPLPPAPASVPAPWPLLALEPELPLVPPLCPELPPGPASPPLPLAPPLPPGVPPAPPESLFAVTPPLPVKPPAPVDPPPLETPLSTEDFRLDPPHAQNISRIETAAIQRQSTNGTLGSVRGLRLKNASILSVIADLGYPKSGACHNSCFRPVPGWPSHQTQGPDVHTTLW
jgi:hypothetical protein